jgi:hypothetical protein
MSLSVTIVLQLAGNHTEDKPLLMFQVLDKVPRCANRPKPRQASQGDDSQDDDTTEC